MPQMTPKWRTAALVLAVLGFVAVALTGNYLGAAINAAIWFGGVYLVFLVVRAIRR